MLIIIIFIQINITSNTQSVFHNIQKIVLFDQTKNFKFMKNDFYEVHINLYSPKSYSLIMCYIFFENDKNDLYMVHIDEFI